MRVSHRKPRDFRTGSRENRRLSVGFCHGHAELNLLAGLKETRAFKPPVPAVMLPGRASRPDLQSSRFQESSSPWDVHLLLCSVRKQMSYPSAWTAPSLKVANMAMVRGQRGDKGSAGHADLVAASANSPRVRRVRVSAENMKRRDPTTPRDNERSHFRREFQEARERTRSRRQSRSRR